MTERKSFVTGLQYARGLLQHEQERLRRAKESAYDEQEVKVIDAQLATLNYLRNQLTREIWAELRGLA